MAILPGGGKGLAEPPGEARHRADTTVPVSLLPVDRLFLLFNIIVAAAFASLARYEPRAWAFVGVHLAALYLPLLLAGAEQRSRGWVSTARQFYPVAFLALYWVELGLRHKLLGGPSQDAMIARGELAIFG